MKAPDFAYHRPQTVDEALALLSGLDNAKLLAGGQSLMPMLNMRYVIPDHVIDLNRVPSLDAITLDATRLHVGALVRQRTVEWNSALRVRSPIFAQALANVGHYQTRTRGTVGGSLCHLDPSAELVLLAALHDAVLHVRGPDRDQDIIFDNWVAGYMAPQLAPDEILTSVTFPLWPGRCGEAFVEFARRRGDFAIASVAIKLALVGGLIARLSVALGGLNIAPIRLRQAEAELLGARPNGEAAARLAAEVETLDVMSDAHVSSNYRRVLCANLIKRAFANAVGSISQDVHVAN